MKLERLLVLYSGFHLFLLIGVLPEWVTAAALGAWALGVIATERRRPWPSWLMQSFAGVGFIATFALVRPIFGIENSACLAAWVLAFQIHHLDSPRARLTQLFVCLFSLSLFLVNQSSNQNMFIMLADLVLFFALLNASQGTSKGFSWQTLKQAFRLIVMTFPIWILIFFLFPRFTLSLWGNEAGLTATSGFADELRPGLIGKVIQRDDVAFRFQFTNPTGENYFYFRGGVLNEIRSGLHWRRGRSENWSPSTTDQNLGFAHQVWLEPRWARALFVAEYAQTVTAGLGMEKDQVESLGASVFQLRYSPRRMVNYQGSSTTVDVRRKLSSAERESTTYLPPDVLDDLAEVKNPPLKTGMTAAQAIFRLSSWYREQEFRYSLQPDSIRSERVSEFLNTKKLGFCEHYSAATAVLLRSVGIPARVVVGFLGGTYNPIAEVYNMLDRDAHAWIEYYDAELERWQRFDPTAIIQPLRLSLGSEIYRFSPEELNQAALGQRSQSWWSQITDRAGLFWDAWGHELERRIVFYDASWMNAVFEDLGIPDWGPWIAGLFALGMGTVLLTFLRRFLGVRRYFSPSEKIINDFRRNFRLSAELQGEARMFAEVLKHMNEDPQPMILLRDRLLRFRYAAKHSEAENNLKQTWLKLKKQTVKDGTRRRVRDAQALRMVRPNISHGDQRRSAVLDRDKPMNEGPFEP